MTLIRYPTERQGLGKEADRDFPLPHSIAPQLLPPHCPGRALRPLWRSENSNSDCGTQTASGGGVKHVAVERSEISGGSAKIIMRRLLHISDDLALPTDTVTSTLIVYGGKGMGKTNFGSVLVEELTASGLRWSVLDPLGVWWGLRHSADGQSSGIECLILGGIHGDIPIEPTAGAVVADLVVNENVNVVIDFSRKPSGEMWSIGEKIKFVTDYAYRLFQRQGELVGGVRREPLIQLLDEAARYIPQVIPHGAENLAKCVGAWEQLVEEGRNIGVGVALLTQRSARMNKSVSEVADAILAFRIVGPNSIGAITDWLGEHVPKAQINSMVETIRSLERGRCLVVSPGWLKFEGVIGIRARHTFDSSATPKPGERARRVRGEGAKPDLAKYVERMKETIDKAKADDPRELRAQIQKLQKELSRRPTEQRVVEKLVESPAKMIPIPSVPAYVIPKLAALRRRFEKLFRDRDEFAAELKQLETSVVGTKDQEEQLLANAKKGAKVAKGTMPASAPMPAPNFTHKSYGFDVTIDRKTGGGTISGPNVRDIPVVATTSSTNGHSKLRAGAERMLAALVQWSPEGMHQSQMRSHAGMKKSGTFTTYMSDLRVGGYIEERNGMLYATESGIQYFGGNIPSAPQSTEDMLAVWSPKLREGARRMLNALVEAGGNPMTLDELATQVNMARSGTFTTYLSDLRTARLIVTDRGSVAANKETLFL
jgi:hypothetical protein